MSDRTLLDTETLVARLHVSRDWWFRHRKELAERFAFPLEISGIPHHWDPVAVDAWLDAQLPEYAARYRSTAPANDENEHERVLLGRLARARL